MQLILDSENTTEAYTRMEALDESVKERTNGILETKGLSSNKENVENIIQKDKLSSKTSINEAVPAEKCEIVSKNFDDGVTDDSRNNEEKVTNSNEIEENVALKTSDDNAEICSSISSKEDLKNDEEQTVEIQQNIENGIQNNVVENVDNDVKDQVKNKEDTSSEKMDVDEDSLTEGSSKNETANGLSNGFVDDIVTKTCSQELSQEKIVQVSNDVVMADEADNSLEKLADAEPHLTSFTETNLENESDVVNSTIDKVDILDSSNEDNLSQINATGDTELAEIAKTITATEDERGIVDSEKRLASPIEIDFEEKEQDITDKSDKNEKDTTGKDTFENSIEPVSTNNCQLVNEDKFIETLLDDIEKEVDMYDVTMEVIEKKKTTEDEENESKNEKQKLSESDEHEVIAEISKKPENNVDSTYCNKKVDEVDSVLDEKRKVEEIPIIGESNQCESTPKLCDIVIDKNKTSNDNAAPNKLLNRTSRLSNTMDILSDDEDEKNSKEPETIPQERNEKQFITLDDDDDVLLVDDIDTNSKAKVNPKDLSQHESVIERNNSPINKDVVEEKITIKSDETESTLIPDLPASENIAAPEINEKIQENVIKNKSFIPENFLSTCKKSVAEMTREDLEEFCVLRIVESVLDKTSLSDIKMKLKTMTQNIEEYKKKAMMLTKQNRDLQVVLKSVQEELKKNTNVPISPFKITRSVGMQVLMTDKSLRKMPPGATIPPSTNSTTPTKTRNGVNNNQNNKQQVSAPIQQIPVPRLVPAQNAQKSNVQNNQKPVIQGPSNVKKSPTVPKVAEKRTHRTASQSVTVDLTDDEPPTKMNRNAGVTPVRVMNQQNLMHSKPNNPQASSPRKVFIPISPQSQPMRPGQALMLRPPAPVVNNTAVRGPNAMRMRMPNSVRVMRMNNFRHPAPLPDHVKQYQSPTWKALPPAPDLKLSKVENGIVISWKIDGYQEDLFEEIASYQLYAYQETSVAPSTSLWKKIGDVKALPLPMACTLTQFMTGYKYYFAVRAVDIRSRVGPFSLPGSILLLNKV